MPKASLCLRALAEESQRSGDKRQDQLRAAKPLNLQGRQINRKVIFMPGRPSEQTLPRSHHKGGLAEQALQSLDIEPREEKKKKRKKEGKKKATPTLLQILSKPASQPAFGRRPSQLGETGTFLPCQR